MVRCEDCDESICSDCDGEELEDGSYICDYCADERDEKEAREAEKTGRPLQLPRSCGACRKVTREYAVKNEGVRCIPCAHKLELELLGGEHDAANCSICTPPKAA